MTISAADAATHDDVRRIAPIGAVACLVGAFFAPGESEFGQGIFFAAAVVLAFIAYRSQCLYQEYDREREIQRKHERRDREEAQDNET